MNDKARERHDVVLEFGLLIQPIIALAEDAGEVTPHDLRIACAKVHGGDAEWRKTVRKLATFAPDIFLNPEFQNLSHCAERFLRDFSAGTIDASTKETSDRIKDLCRKRIKHANDDLYNCLNAIPIEWKSEIFEANTPFTSYLKIKDAISCARGRIYYFDRYLKPQFYEMYLRDIDRNIVLRVVTTVGNANYGVEAVKSVSELVRIEFADYQLLKVDPKSMHDRNLVIDSVVYSLGPGLDQAGTAPTNFTTVSDAVSAVRTLEAVIAAGENIHV